MAVALNTDTGILCVVSSVQCNTESTRAEALSYRVYSIYKKLVEAKHRNRVSSVGNEIWVEQLKEINSP